MHTPIYIYIYGCVCVYIYIYGYVGYSHKLNIQTQTPNFKNNMEVHPSGKILCKPPRFCSEIIAGEIIAKSPYYERYPPPDAQDPASRVGS